MRRRERGRGGGHRGREGTMEGKIRDIEKRIERMEREREERRKNIVVKEVSGVSEVSEGRKEEGDGGGNNERHRNEGKDREDMQNERGNGNGRGKERGTEMVWMKLENKEQRREVMERKRILKGREERIVEDLT